MRCLLPVLGLLAGALRLFAAPTEGTVTPPPGWKYLWARAWHVLPETHNNESGYSSLCEGKNGRFYIGTAKYGVNAYLVEFDPATGQQRIVIDVNKVTGATGTGYASQSKIHTPNFVGPSGTIYVGSKQGYATPEDIANKVEYPGGYVMTYDPATERAESLGMPWPGLGVIDVVADEPRGLIYVSTCEEGHWMLYSRKTKRWRELGPRLPAYMPTLVDNRGRAHVLTLDFQLATYDPATETVTLRPIADDPIRFFATRHKIYPYNGILAADGRTAYFNALNDPALYTIDLFDTRAPVRMRCLGTMLQGNHCDSRSSLCLAPDGAVYRVIRIDNTTGFGSLCVHHVARYTPSTKRMEDLGVLAVENPDFYPLRLQYGGAIDPATGKVRINTHGYHRLPDDTLTPYHNHLAARVAHDGTLYVTILYPFTLLRIPAERLMRPAADRTLPPSPSAGVTRAGDASASRRIAR